MMPGEDWDEQISEAKEIHKTKLPKKCLSCLILLGYFSWNPYPYIMLFRLISTKKPTQPNL